MKIITATGKDIHTLQHLENLLGQLTEVKHEIKNWDTILFSLYYHDVIYNALKTTNEEKSAAFAENRMQTIGVPQSIIENCIKQILATKKHIASEDGDINFFTDADLCILGQEWDIYWDYYKKIRKEYSLFPDIIYIPGRKKYCNIFYKWTRSLKQISSLINLNYRQKKTCSGNWNPYN